MSLSGLWRPHLSRSDVDAGGVGMAASSVGTVAVVDWLTLVSVLPPAGQTLTGVSTWSRLHTFSLQGAAHRHSCEDGLDFLF